VAFPPSVGAADLLFDQGVLKFGCALTDGTNTYLVTAVQPVTSVITSTLAVESNIAYCRLDDISSNVPLKTGLGVVYRLTITLTSVKIASTNFLRAISLFTATSNNPDKMIIDSIPVIGTAALYGDYTAATPKALDIMNASVTVTQGPSVATATTTVYAYNQFDVSLTLKANSFITAADHIIVFRYPTNTVSPATTVLTTAAAANDANQVLLAGNLAVQPFGTDALYLTGVTEDLIPNRQFVLTLKGWKALDTNIGTPAALMVVVYYKNTFSILSYVQNNIFNVAKDSLTITANHPESWDVYRGGAWPIAFTFKTGTDLVNGGWVVIQQSNTVDSSATAGNKITFVPSTCDFSGNDSSFDNSFGKRPSCFPLRTFDTAYTGAGATAYNGSGFFFWMKGTVANGKAYKVTVWAFFDVCGGTQDSSMNAIGGLNVTVPNFIATIYRTIFPALLNDQRFVGTSQSVLSVSSSTAFAGNCFNNVVFADAAVGDHWSTVPQGKTTATLAGTPATDVAFLNYREYFDWNAYSITYDNFAAIPGTGTAPWWKASTDFTAPTSSNFLYSTSNSIGSGSYFLVGFATAKTTSTDLSYKLPIPAVVIGGPAFAAAPGRWYWQFPAQWFAAGNGYKVVTGAAAPTCFASWSIATAAGATITGTGATSSLLPTFTTVAPAGQITGLDANNYFGANVTTGATIDGTKSLLPPDNTAAGVTGKASIVRLVSTYNNGAGGNNWNIASIFLTKFTVTTNVVYNVGLFTSCLKWVSTTPAITSLYTYIDIQIKWNYIGTAGTTSGDGVTLSNIRLIKLFPETGVFNDFAKNSNNVAAVSPLLSHTIYTASGADSVCLLELSGANFATSKDTTSNTLVIWIFGGTLLETDYNDASSVYPVAPLVSGITSYGLQSGSWLDSSNPNLTVGTNQTPLLYQLSLNNNAFLAAGAAPGVANSSSYMFFMGSVVYLTSVTTTALTSTTTEQNFFIPYYCPRFISANSGAITVIKAQVFPVVMAAWITSSSFNSVGPVNTWFTYSETAGVAFTTKVMANRIVAGKQTVAKAAGVTAASTLRQATLKWGAYTTADNSLYVYNGSVTAAGTVASCTGHSLFLNASIQVTASTLAYVSGLSAGSIGLFAGTKNFYIFGSFQQKYLLWTCGKCFFCNRRKWKYGCFNCYWR